MISGNALWGKEITTDMSFQSLNGKAFYTYESMPSNLYDMLSETADKSPMHIALIDNQGIEYTYISLLKLADQFASYLTDRIKVEKGAHAALMMYNSVEFCVSFLALCKIGAVTVPLPSKYKEAEVVSLADKADLNLILCDENFYNYFSRFEHSGVKIIKSVNSDQGYGFSHLDLENLPPCKSSGILSDPVMIMFTSGTTSGSKGVLIRNYNMMHAIISYHRILQITEEDKSILATPIYHITGIVALFGLFVYAGGTLYLHRTFNAARVLTCVKDNNVTLLHASPTVFSMLLEERDNFMELPSLKTFACGSSNMAAATLTRLHDWLPHTAFHTVYGLTETTSPATIFPSDACTSPYIGSSGLPIPGVEVKIVAEDKSELPCNEVGEILLRGSVVIDQYYNLPSSDFFEDGWLATGDLGYLNSEHYLYIVDRKKDMINRGGEKIWSFDIENEIGKIPGVLETAVVGAADEKYGEVPVAVVRMSPGYHTSAEEIKAVLKPRLAGFQIPQAIIFVDSIPKTPNDKVDKKYIRDQLKE